MANENELGAVIFVGAYVGMYLFAKFAQLGLRWDEVESSTEEEDREHLQQARREHARHAFEREIAGSAPATVDSVAELIPGLVSFAGRVRVGNTLGAPLSGREALGYRLVGSVGSERHRRKLIDFSVTRGFELETAAGQRVVIRTSAVEILGWPPRRLERPGWSLERTVRDLIFDRHPGIRARDLVWKWLSWAEWILCPGDLVRVVGVAEEVVAEHGTAAPYRTANRCWAIGPTADRPVMVLVGDQRVVTSGFWANPEELPSRHFPEDEK